MRDRLFSLTLYLYLFSFFISIRKIHFDIHSNRLIFLLEESTSILQKGIKKWLIYVTKKFQRKAFIDHETRNESMHTVDDNVAQ